MGKKYKITVQHFLLESVKITKEEINLIQGGFIDNSKLDGVFFYAKGRKDLAHPLYVRVIVKRQSTKFKSPGLHIDDKFKIYNYEDFENGAMLKREKADITKITGNLDYTSAAFRIAGLGGFIEMVQMPVYDAVFDRVIKEFYHLELSRLGFNELSKIINWEAGLYSINRGLKNLISSANIDKIMTLHDITLKSCYFKPGDPILLFQWVDSQFHEEYIQNLIDIDLKEYVNTLDKVVTDIFRLALQHTIKVEQ